MVLKLTTDDDCLDTDTEIKYLEHVVSRISLQSTYRGDTAIYLTSPQGTRSQLLHYRPTDRNRAKFLNWSFMSTHHWGENPKGEWWLEIQKSRLQTRTVLDNWVLIFHGTKYPPEQQTRPNLYPKRAKGQNATSSIESTIDDPYVRLQQIQPRIKRFASVQKGQTPTEEAMAAEPTVHHTAAIVLLTLCGTVAVILMVSIVAVIWKRRKVTWIVKPQKENNPYLFESSRLLFEDETSMSD